MELSLLVPLVQPKQYRTELECLVRGGVSQALRATDYKDPPKILVYEK